MWQVPEEVKMIEYIREYMTELDQTIQKLPVEKIDQFVHVLQQCPDWTAGRFSLWVTVEVLQLRPILFVTFAKNTAFPDLPGFKVIGLSV